MLPSLGLALTPSIRGRMCADYQHHGCADHAADTRPVHQELPAVPGSEHQQVADAGL